MLVALEELEGEGGGGCTGKEVFPERGGGGEAARVGVIFADENGVGIRGGGDEVFPGDELAVGAEDGEGAGVGGGDGRGKVRVGGGIGCAAGEERGGGGEEGEEERAEMNRCGGHLRSVSRAGFLRWVHGAAPAHYAHTLRPTPLFDSVPVVAAAADFYGHAGDRDRGGGAARRDCGGGESDGDRRGARRGSDYFEQGWDGGIEYGVGAGGDRGRDVARGHGGVARAGHAECRGGALR